MTSYPRYAIYFAPAPDSALNRFGAHLLGYDAFTGGELPFPDGLIATVPDWQELTRDPRKYGFHATLKAPFALAPDRGEAGLLAACEAFCGAFSRECRPVPEIRPVVRTIGDFIALVPDQPSPALQSLAQSCVETFDSFRAPLDAADRARRNPAALTPRQTDYLDRWGYPYVMEEFRFHMTLSGRVPAERREAILAMLRDRYAMLGESLTRDGTGLAIDRLAVFRQDDAQSRFRVIAHHALRSQDTTAP